MRVKCPSLLAALKHHPRHADALEFTQLFHSINFAHTLRVSEADLVRYDVKEGLETTHAITPYLCRTDSRGAYLSVGVITALFDEISTAACILQDQTHRPGVSIALDVEVLANIPPGRTLLLKTWADKLGKSLAFLRLDLRDAASGQLVAVGKHCKFLPMAGVPFWDAAFAPTLYPLLRRPLMGLTRHHVAKGERVEWHGQASLYDYFPLEKLVLSGEGGGGKEEDGKEEEKATTTASLHIKPRHCNGLFNMHGGALAMVAEDVAVRDAAARLQSSSSSSSAAAAAAAAPRARSLNLHYFQANSKMVDVAAWVNDAAEVKGEGGREGTSMGVSSQIEVRRGGKLCNHGTILWQEE